MDDEIGFFEVGKKVDFVVLEEDLFMVDFMSICDIGVWGMVFFGWVF